MTGIISTMLLTVVFGGAFWTLYLKDKLNSKASDKTNVYIVAVMLIGVVARIIAAVCYYGHKTDMGCFIGWSGKLFRNGLSEFYVSEGFHDYPPGYVYVMYVLGAVKSLLGLESGDVGLQLLIKAPAMIVDLVMGYLAYRFATKRFSNSASAMLSALIILNPTLILNSAMWGQVDSILALFCILTVYYSAEKKFIPAVAAFAAGMLIKPQAFFIFPVLAFSLIEDIWLCGGFDKKKLIKHALTGLCGVAAMFILFMPFGKNPIDGIGIILNQYIETTLEQYNYMTVNAFNAFAAVGNNWEKLTNAASVMGYLAMAVVAVYSGYVFFKSKSPAKHYICAFILFFGIFMFGVKMHERYAFPGIIMLFYAFLIMPKTVNLVMYGLFTFSQFFNTAWILFIYNQDINKYFRDPVVAVASVINLVLCAVFVYIIQKEYVNYREVTVAVKQKGYKTNSYKSNRNTKPAVKKEVSVDSSEPKQKITKSDVIFVALITVVYSAIALYNLGNMFAPETGTVIPNEGITVDFGEEKEIKKLEFYLGARQLHEGRNLVIDFMDEDKNAVKNLTETKGDVFDWTIKDTDVTARYVKLSTNCTPSETDPSEKLYMNEICFLDAEGKQYVPVNSDAEEIAAIFDEQHMMASGKDFMSGTIFDEIYHPRTAYEFVHNMSVYEWTHPPLGKIFIGLGISIFGMVPFGWRIAGTVFGIFMIPIIYAFARKMLKYKWLAAAVCVIFTFDFMHFTQTRLGTIDTYVTFFIMLMYYYMYRYYKLSFYDTPLGKTLVPLGLSGVFFGLAVASKWTGLYAGAGLAVIFFYTIYRRYTEYQWALKTPKSSTGEIEHSHITNVFMKNTLTTLAFCVVMFVIVPVIIYTLSYAPFWDTPSGKGIGTAFSEIERMWTYHSKTVANSTHSFSSHWYEWPIMYRPIYYFSNTLEDGLRQGISAFGNPAVWWMGIPAFAYVLALTIIIPLKERNYLGRNKWFYAEVYAVVFAVFCVMAFVAGNGNEKLERLFVCVLMYSIIMTGVFALVMMYDEAVKQKSNKTALFLSIAYIVQLAPWVLVTRTTYIYHYFPSVPFVVLMIGYSVKTLYDNAKDKKAVIIGTAVYTVIAVGLFVMFYPVLSGATFDVNYGKEMLRWFDSWVLFPDK